MVQLTDLSFAYTKEKGALFHQLDLSLTGGTICGLLGKNGAGKTTLLKIICGLLFPRAGASTVLGCDTRRRSPEFLQDLYFIPEQFHVPSVTVAAYRKYYAPFYPRFNGTDFDAWLEEFGIRPNQRLTALSYGNKKKFLVAFGLATHCRVLILDEPTNGLDIPSKSRFRKLVAGALTEDRLFIVSTHQVRDTENLIDPIIILDNGQVVFHHTTQEIAALLSAQTVDDPARIENVLYSEKTLAGFRVVAPRTTGTESRIDLELLFNAVISDTKAMEALFAERGA